MIVSLILRNRNHNLFIYYDFVNNIWGKVLQPSLCTGCRNGQEFRKDGLPIPQVPDTHLKGARLNFSKTHGWARGHYNGHYEPLKG